ncbi:MAG TPA: hypothetical protein VG964_03280 [Candidatus Saccharimonadales bacterium]|nr:hypothetical protein [Candidatus Saccharimonadales bacterium]
MFLKLPLVHFLAAQVGPCTLPGADKNPFFGLPHWWVYMNGISDGAGGCSPHFVFPASLFQIGLAAIDILLHIAGFVAVIAVIVSGIGYMFAIGNPEKITSARKGIQNSLIGLGIALAAAQIVAFIGEKLT